MKISLFYIIVMTFVATTSSSAYASVVYSATWHGYLHDIGASFVVDFSDLNGDKIITESELISFDLYGEESDSDRRYNYYTYVTAWTLYWDTDININGNTPLPASFGLEVFIDKWMEFRRDGDIVNIGSRNQRMAIGPLQWTMTGSGLGSGGGAPARLPAAARRRAARPDRGRLPPSGPHRLIVARPPLLRQAVLPVRAAAPRPARSGPKGG